MNKIFEQAKDLHVVATMVYNNGDEFAYADAECTKKFTVSELNEVFVKGALINIEGGLYKAVCFTNEAIHYINAAGSIVALKAAEKIAE